MKIVKFENGKFGLRTGNWLFGYEFLCDSYYTWSSIEHVEKYCQFKYLDEVKSIIENNPIKHTVLKKTKNPTT